MPAEPRFFSVGNILRIHDATIEKHGGARGVRDTNLLESAIMTPMQSFGGAYLHPDLPSMAAAYLFHLVKNHPFVDGNKRVGALTALLFLRGNGAERLPLQTALEEVTMAVASGDLEKEQLIRWFRVHTRAGLEGSP